MKKYTLTIFIINFVFTSLFSQSLTLTDLTQLCSKKNWETVNQVLLSKGWEYYESEKGNAYNYNTITWSLNKEYYSDRAEAWFYLYTYEGFPNKISYTVFNKDSYSKIQNSLTSLGFKLTNSEIEDDEIISIYANANYILKISTEKRKTDNWESRTFTAYRIVLIKKSGVYDPDNGKKTEYYFGDVIKSEYTLSNGKLNGQLKAYHYNGELKKVGNYKNGVENGSFKEYDLAGNLEIEYSMLNGELNGSIKVYYPTGKLKKTGSFLKGEEHGNFIEYNEYGEKTAEYVMKNGKKNGVLKFYEDGKLEDLITFKDDVKNGEYINYSYDDDTNELRFKLVGNYLDDEKNGTWQIVFIEEDNIERVLSFENFTRNVKDGKFQKAKGDSLIIGFYRNDKLHGEYKVYIDLLTTMFGGIISTDIDKLVLTDEGSYYQGSKSGYWKNYYISGTLQSEGSYSDGHKTGEWKFYHANWRNDQGESEPFSEQLHLVQNYSEGKLNGKSIRYSYLKEEEFPCSEVDDNANPIDTCARRVFQKIHETSFYKNDELNGPYELRDSTDELIAKGFFKDNLKEGEWLHRYIERYDFGMTYSFSQKGNYMRDKREGKWDEYYPSGSISTTSNYKNNQLHGEYMEWNTQTVLVKKKQFVNGKLSELITYDSLGINPVKKYEIYDENNKSFKCRNTVYFEDGYTSQEYFLKKVYENDHSMFELMFTISVNNLGEVKETGYKDGIYQFFNSKKQPIVTGEYFKEDKIGLWSHYYYDQNIKIESNYEKNDQTSELYLTLDGDVFSGIFVFNDDANRVKERRKIKKGLRNGTTVFVDMDTQKTIKKEKYKDGKLK